MEKISTSNMRFNVIQQESYSKAQLLLRTFLGPFYLILPQVLYLIALFIVVKSLAIYVSFYILLKGELPQKTHQFFVQFLQHASAVHLRVYNLADGYPSFQLSKADAAFELTIPYRQFPNRKTVLLRFLVGWAFLWLPHFTLWAIRNIINVILVIPAFFAVLITGKYPNKLFEFQVNTLRWPLRVIAYGLYLTDDYPPFSGK